MCTDVVHAHKSQDFMCTDVVHAHKSQDFMCTDVVHAHKSQDFMCTDVVHAHKSQDFMCTDVVHILHTVARVCVPSFPGHHCGVVHATLCVGQFVPSERRLEGLCAMGQPALPQLLSDVTTLKRSSSVHSR